MRPFALPFAVCVAVSAPAAAEPFRATYGVIAAGLTVMEVEAVFDLDSPGAYRIETTVRMTGFASAFISGQQVTEVRGVWAGDVARPVRFVTDGVWRGNPRSALLEYPEGQPVVRSLVPPNETEREAVPPELIRGTMDNLSALAQLTRLLAATQRCDGSANVYDGRRRTNFSASTGGWERLPAWRGAWTGTAMRCGFEGRQVAGFLLDQDRAEEWRRPQQGTAWMASVQPGTPPVPVRIEMQTRFFGRMTAYLLRSSATSRDASTPPRTGTSAAGVAATGAPPAIAPVP